MGPLAELIAVDHRQTLEFFCVRLRDVSPPDVDREELLYNASVLAHYAQNSTHADTSLGTPANLSAVFDHFVFDQSLWQDGQMMEVAGAQCLLMAGFFEHQMSQRYNIRWYAELGINFFTQAAQQESSPHKARLLRSLGRRFEPWRRRHAAVSRELRDIPYLIQPPSNRPSFG